MLTVAIFIILIGLVFYLLKEREVENIDFKTRNSARPMYFFALFLAVICLIACFYYYYFVYLEGGLHEARNYFESLIKESCFEDQKIHLAISDLVNQCKSSTSCLERVLLFIFIATVLFLFLAILFIAVKVT